jgi:hypothetical protein
MSLERQEKFKPDSNLVHFKSHRTGDFTTVNNRFINDASLDWESKGMLLYLLSRPPEWQIIISDLINKSTNGRDSVYKILKNLQEKRYLKREVLREDSNNKGRITKNIYHIFEIPYEPEENNAALVTALPNTAPPLPAMPDQVEPTLLIIDNINNNYIKTDQTEESLTVVESENDKVINFPDPKIPACSVFENKISEEERAKAELIIKLIELQEEDPFTEKTANNLIAEYGYEKVNYYFYQLNSKLETGWQPNKTVASWLINTLKNNIHTFLSKQETEHVSGPVVSKETDLKYHGIFALCRELEIIPQAMRDHEKINNIAEFFLMKYHYNFIKKSEGSNPEGLIEVVSKVKQVINFNDFKMLMQAGQQNSQRSYANENTLGGFLGFYQGVK